MKEEPVIGGPSQHMSAGCPSTTSSPAGPVAGESVYANPVASSCKLKIRKVARRKPTPIKVHTNVPATQHTLRSALSVGTSPLQQTGSSPLLYCSPYDSEISPLPHSMQSANLEGLIQNCAISYDGTYGWVLPGVSGGSGFLDQPPDHVGSVENSHWPCEDLPMEIQCNTDKLQISALTHAALLSSLPHVLRGEPFLDTESLRETLIAALDSLDAFAPIFHRPSLLANNLPVHLLLTLINYGLLMNNARTDTYATGLQIHSVVRRFLYDCDNLSANANLHFLQAMFVHELSGTFLGQRSDHEKSDALRGQMFAMARRASFFVQESLESGFAHAHGLRVEDRWLEWAQRESVKRLALFIFVNDVQHVVLFSHAGILKIEDLRLTLPCSDELWQAPMYEWTLLQCHNQAMSTECKLNYRDTVKAFVIDDLASINLTTFEPLHQYLTIHGLLSLVSEYAGKRERPTILQDQSITRFNESQAQVLYDALICFEAAIEKTRTAGGAAMDIYHPLARNSCILIRVAKIGLNIGRSDMEVCAGAIYSAGEAVNANRVSLAWHRVSETNFTDTSICAALQNIQDLCCNSQLQPNLEFRGIVHESPEQMLGHEMILTGCIYQSALLLWTYSMTLQPQGWSSLECQGGHSPRSLRELLATTSNYAEDIRIMSETFRSEASSSGSIEILKNAVVGLLIVASAKMARSRSSIDNEWRGVLLSLVTNEQLGQ